jgi:hypothetical protein
MTERKRTNNDQQNTTQKTNDRPIRTPLKMEVKSGGLTSSCSTIGTPRVTLVINHE